MKHNFTRFITENTDAHEAAMHVHWRGVFFFGPELTENADEEEILVWRVFFGNARGEAVDTVLTYEDFATAERIAKCIARTTGRELIHQAAAA